MDLFIYLYEQNPDKMSFQTFVTERLEAITSLLNDISANAKKIFELPVQNTLDPASLIHVSRGGTSESLEIQKIIDAITEKNYSQLLAIGDITVSGLNVNVPSAAMWVYEGVIHQTTAITVIAETLCATGFLRKDILVANQSNQIVLVKGVESETIRIKPNIPIGTVFVTEIDVDDAVIGTPTAPILNGDYIPKIDKSHILLQSSGVLNFHPFAFKARYNGIVLDGTYTSLGGVSYSIPSSSLYSGRKLTIRNNQSTPVDLLHNSSLAAVKFMFPNGVDFVIKSKEVIEFIYRPNTSSTGWYDYVGNINDIPAHNSLTGLNAGDYQHLTVAEKAAALATFIKSDEALSGAQRKDDVLYGILDQYTGEEITLSKVTGTPTVDGVIYFQLGAEYFKRNFNEYANVKWWGAVGNGVFSSVWTGNDDTEAFLNAVSTGLNIYIPKGNFIITHSSLPAATLPDSDFRYPARGLNLQNNQKIKGDGDETVIVMKGYVNGTASTYFSVFFIQNKNNIKVEKLKITGQTQVYEDETTFNYPCTGIAIWDNSYNIEVDDCVFSYILGHGVQENSTNEFSNNYYTNNKALYVSQDGFNLDGKRMFAYGNYAKGCGFHGIEASSGNSILENNILEFNKRSGITIGGYNSAENNGYGSSNIVSNNVCNNNVVSGISVATGCENSVISNNNLFLNGRFGIEMSENFTRISNNIVTGNNIYDNGDTVTAIRIGIYCNQDGNFISNNNIYNSPEEIPGTPNEYRSSKGIVIDFYKDENAIFDNNYKNIPNIDLEISGENTNTKINENQNINLVVGANSSIYSFVKKASINYSTYPITIGESWLSIQNNTSSKIALLPKSENYGEGREMFIIDDLGFATTNSLTLTVQTGEKLNGVVDGTYVLNLDYGFVKLISLGGVKGWKIIAEKNNITNYDGVLKVGSELNFKTDTDEVNGAVQASYIYPTTTFKRVFLGTNSLKFYSLNLKNIDELEGVPVFKTPDEMSYGNNITSGASVFREGNNAILKASTASGYAALRTNENDRFKANHDGSLEIQVTPTTSASTYHILTRNDSTGVVEKVSSSIYSDLIYGTDVSLSTGQSPYTLLSTDANARVTANTIFNQNFSIVIPTNATIPYIIGTKIRINCSNANASWLTLSGDVGVTIIGGVSATPSIRYGSSCIITKVAINTWRIDHLSVIAINSSNRIVTTGDSGFSGLFEGTFNGNLSTSYLQNYTVATLPVSPTQGQIAYVTDATAPTYLGTLTGGGSVKCPVFFNGSAWVSH